MRKALALVLSLALLLTLPLPTLAEDLFSEKDLTLATAEGATQIVLSGESVTIDQEGTYVVSGDLQGGALRISLATEGTVYLLLNGVTVQNDGAAALYTENCKKVVLTLAEGTINTFTQGATANEDENAAIYSRDDLTINGQGTLVINGEYKDGINCRDSLKIVSGTVEVNAADDGLVGKDAVIIGGGIVTVTAAHDGIKATNEEDEDRGYVTLAGGQITIQTGGKTLAAAEAAESAPAVQAPPNEGNTAPDGQTPPNDGALPPDAPAEGLQGRGPGGENAPQDMGKPMGGHGGMGGGRGGMDGNRPTNDNALNDSTFTESGSSAKGVKAITTLTVSGGTVQIAALDDALHSQDVVISGGELTLSSGDDGIHADHSLTINGGLLMVTDSYEGLEAANILLSGGDVTVTASDDGVNGAGGDAGEETETGWGSRGFGGFDRFSSSTGTLTIIGGILRVSARGDGVDVNGSIAMSGGELYINGPTNAGNGALDYDGEFALTGGIVMALGASGMAQGINAPSVPGVMASVKGTPGTISLQDESGNTLLSMEAAIQYDSAVIYGAELQDGASYTLVTPEGSQEVTVSTQPTVGNRW